jgi:hypothetical protein
LTTEVLKSIIKAMFPYELVREAMGFAFEWLKGPDETL